MRTIHRWLPHASIALTLLAALLVCSTEIQDRDFGFHVALGRALVHDFGAVGRMTLGQDPSSTIYAYSYWLYQVTVARLFDALGPGAAVAFRTALILGTLGIGLWLARRLKAPAWAIAIALAFGVSIAHDRFVDRPDVASHLMWMAAVSILTLHRRDRLVFWLVPLQVLWVNTHLYFAFLPALVVAFAAGDALDRSGNPRRSALLVLALLAASFLNPAGPATWATQFSMLRVLKGAAVPFPIVEMMSPYAPFQPFLEVWIFRIGMPLTLAALFFARRRIGAGPLLAVLLAALLGASARRAMSLFAVTAIAFLPAALAGIRVRLLPWISTGGTACLGLLAVIGLVNGRIYLAQDQELRLGAAYPRFPAGGAARFLHAEGVEGPLFHNPESAGAILMENGTRLTPFLDARWVGTREATLAYHDLTQANRETVQPLWETLTRRFRFEAVVIDFYAMPALLRHLASSGEWALVYVDQGAAVFARRGGVNQGVIDRAEPRIVAGRPGPDPAREAALGKEALRFLKSQRPSPLARLEFPFDALHRGNFALQIGSRYGAQAAYLDLFRRERGALHASRHRDDVLGNTLWCLEESGEAEAMAALCGELLHTRGLTPERTRGLLMTEAQALLRLARPLEARHAAEQILADPAAAPSEVWWAWSCIARSCSAEGDPRAVADARRAAARALPDAADTWRSLGAVLDQKLARPEEAIEAYERYRALGGRDPAVDARITALRSSP